MITAAVIGLGWWGRQIIKCLQESTRIRVTHGIDVAAAQLGDFAREYRVKLSASIDEVLADRSVAAIIVATPHSTHEELCLRALAAGKQLFCEKPLTLTAVGAERILAACDKAGVTLGIGHERRFEPAMELLAAKVNSGALGEILHLEANMSHNLFATLDASNWRVGAKDAPAGAMTALGIHVTDLFMSLVGRPKRVIARTARVYSRMTGDDHVSAQIDFASGVTGSFVCISSTPYHGRFTVFGTKGWMEIKENANVDQGEPSDVTIADAKGHRTYQSFLPANTVLANLEAWAKAVSGEAQYRFSRMQLLDNVRVLEAIVTSAKEGSPAVLL
ncbi:MAG: Gfo/Idh/MocA family oxidoreductase [Betaproteobacteria bacterium]|nr:Gfo/Idh/MocA family oxidoreductase [Betaproteobacteria bacterium]